MREYQAEIQGRTIAIATTESNCYFRAYNYCKKHGLSVEDIEISCKEY